MCSSDLKELVGIPDPETFVQLPWDKRVGRVFVTCFRNREERKNPGGHLTSDCRGNLRIFMDEFKKKHGLELRIGLGRFTTEKDIDSAVIRL